MQECERKEYRIEGDPVAKARPRFFRKGGYMGTFTPDNTVNWENYLKSEVLRQGRVWFEGAVSLTCQFFLKRPKSLPKKVVDHLKKPDIDNLLKSVKDALNGICYPDDSHIVKVIATKEYGIRRGVLITLVSLQEK